MVSTQKWKICGSKKLNMPTETIKTGVRSLLSDNQWHGCSELLQFGLSYRNRISEYNQDTNSPFCIVSEKDGNKPTYRYRLALRKDCREVRMQGGMRYEIIQPNLI